MTLTHLGSIKDYNVSLVEERTWYSTKGNFYITDKDNNWKYLAATLQEAVDFCEGKIQFDTYGMGCLEYHANLVNSTESMPQKMYFWLYDQIKHLKTLPELDREERRIIMFANFYKEFNFNLSETIYKNMMLRLSEDGHH